jgi:hypothetical protein
MSANAVAATTVAVLYGNDDVAATPDEWVIEGNEIVGVAGHAMAAIHGVITKNVRILSNRIVNFASGFAFYTGDLGDGYSHHLVEISNNVFDNTGAPSIYASGGTVKQLKIQNNSFLTATTDAPIILSTTPDTGIISGNTVDNTFLYDFVTGVGMANVFIDHHLTTNYAGQGWLGGYMALGSRLYRRDVPIVYEKVLAGTTLRRVINDNATGAYTCNAAGKGDRIHNTGTDNVATWYCNGTAWVAK